MHKIYIYTYKNKACSYNYTNLIPANAEEPTIFACMQQECNPNKKIRLMCAVGP